MGARASVMLTQGDHQSPVLCQHCGGREFHKEVWAWIKARYADDHSEDNMKPANRLEPDRLFIKLVQQFGEDGYVGKDRNEVDDSDYGCLVIELGKDRPSANLDGIDLDDFDNARECPNCGHLLNGEG